MSRLVLNFLALVYKIHIFDEAYLLLATVPIIQHINPNYWKIRVKQIEITQKKLQKFIFYPIARDSNSNNEVKTE